MFVLAVVLATAAIAHLLRSSSMTTETVPFDTLKDPLELELRFAEMYDMATRTYGLDVDPPGPFASVEAGFKACTALAARIRELQRRLTPGSIPIRKDDL
jgi:hypothetical protein